MSELEARLREAVSRLPVGLREHIARVEVEAARLAGLHGIDPERVTFAVLGHDLVRAEPPDELLRMSAAYVHPDAVQRASPILLHGPIAAELLKREYSCSDGQVLAAVRWHTSG
ncbi:MAG TPA: HD domain-containing protein, partial [Dehalococcoidia bacterium]